MILTRGETKQTVTMTWLWSLTRKKLERWSVCLLSYNTLTLDTGHPVDCGLVRKGKGYQPKFEGGIPKTCVPFFFSFSGRGKGNKTKNCQRHYGPRLRLLGRVSLILHILHILHFLHILHILHILHFLHILDFSSRSN